MKVKTTMRQMKNAKVNFISLVTRGANRIPFRVLKSQGEDNMLDLTHLRHVFKNEPAPAQAKPTSMGFAAILRGGKPAPQSVVRAASVQPVAKHVETNRTISPASSSASERQQQQVQEERQRQGLAPNQPLHATPAPRRAGNVPNQPLQATPAPRRAGNTPKQPAPSRDTLTLKELRVEIDNALTRSKKQDAQEQFNSGRSAFSQLAPTQQHHVGHGGAGDAWSLRNHGAQLAVQLLGGTDKPLPTNTAFRAFSAAGTKA